MPARHLEGAAEPDTVLLLFLALSLHLLRPPPTLFPQVLLFPFSILLLIGSLFYAISCDEMFPSLSWSIHVSGLSWPDSLQKTNMASIRSKDQSNIRVLLSSFYWNSLTKNRRGEDKRREGERKIYNY